ncbi:MAG TPA: hypothetical protein VGB66_13815 [Longimicrobium sp.]|jgi:hypothetical protein
MPARIRFMSWNLMNYGTSRINKYDLAPLIARLMRDYQIDVCALLEIEKNAHLQVRTSIATELVNLGYQPNSAWRHDFVELSDEGVAFLWHEAPVGANAFRALAYANNPGSVISGPVFKDNAGTQIYFPMTGTNWASLPGMPAGRRPAFCAFETNDGQLARRFTCLGLHAPDAHGSIQSYSTHLYGRSREIWRVETDDPKHALVQNAAAAAAFVQPQIIPLLTGPFGAIPPNPSISELAVQAARSPMVESFKKGHNLETALLMGALAAAAEAVAQAAPHMPAVGVAAAHAQNLARAAAEIGAGTVMHMLASFQLPATVAGPVASPAVAANMARNNAALALAYHHPVAKQLDAVRAAAIAAAGAAVGGFTFAGVPTGAVDSAVVAGDFNVWYPDAIQYQPAETARLNGGNAYTALLNLPGGAGECIQGATSCAGPGTFKGARVYRLKNAPTIQDQDAAFDNYVPLDVSTMAGHDYLGHNTWQEALRELARAQGQPWKPLVDEYGLAISGSFDMLVLNDTEHYRASPYDNIFLRNAAWVASGVIDVHSELGSWPLDPAWPAARGRLTHIAQTELTRLLTAAQLADATVTNVTFASRGLTFDVSPAVVDAEEAAVFYLWKVSDHLPVSVTVDL